MNDIFINKKSFFIFNSNKFNELKIATDNSSRHISRYLIHTSREKKVQEMIIMMKKDCLIKPNRIINKSESLTVIFGELLLMFFDDNGKLTEKIKLSTADETEDFNSSYRIESPLWHTMVPISNYVCVHEILEGPFENVKDEPTWLENSEESLKKLIDKYK